MRNHTAVSLGALLLLITIQGVTSVQAETSLPTPPYPVLFIHGINSDATTWDDLKDFLVDCSWTNGGSPSFAVGEIPANDSVTGGSVGTFYTMNMSDSESNWPSQNLTYRQQGYEVGKVVQRIKTLTGKTKVILVGHSMGGLAARAYIEGKGDWDGARHLNYGSDVEKVITIGTPHQGSPLATILPNLSIGDLVGVLLDLRTESIAVQALQAGSSELNDLNAGTLPTPIKYISIIANGVPIILYPDETGDGVVSSHSQNLGNLAIASGKSHSAKHLTIIPWGFLSPSHLETHTYETRDLQVWDELIRQLSTTDGLPGALDLEIVANQDPVRPGDRFQVVMTVANRGATDLAGVVLRMATPDHTYLSSSEAAPAPDISGGYSDGDVAMWSLGSLAAGKSRTVLVSLAVDSGSSAPPDGTVLPVSALVVSSNGASSAESVSVVVDSTPGLQLMLSEDREPVAPGSQLRYTVTFANPSAVSVPGTTMRVLMPTGATFDSATGGGTLNGSWVEWSLGTLAAGQSGHRFFTVGVGAGVSNGTILLAQGELLNNEVPQEMARAEAATAVWNSPLSLEVAASPDPVRPGTLIQVVMTVTNRGASDLAGVELRMATPDHTYLSSSQAAPAPDVSGGYSDGDVAVWSFGTLAAGQGRTVLVSLEVDSNSSAPPDGKLLTVMALVVSTNRASSAGSASVAVNDALCTWEILPLVGSFPIGGGSNSFSVNPSSGSGCVWTTTVDSAWISITQGRSGTGAGIVNYSVGVNPDIERTGYISVAGNIFTVIQAGNIPNPQADNDLDGIPNGWEQLNGLNPNVSNSPGANADGDWTTDIEEYIADTKPTNNASFFSPVIISNALAGTMVLVVDPTSTGRVYGIRWCTNLLLRPQIWSLYPPERTGTGSAVTFTITNSVPTRIYRTGVRLP